MKENYDCLIEWAIWGNLDRKKDLELILLKGHLIIEKVLEIKLQRINIQNIEEKSFYSKVLVLERIEFVEIRNKETIIQILKNLNQLRNKLAHEVTFKLDNGELEFWGSEVLKNFTGEKYTRFTYRTKIIHAFSILARNILEQELKLI